MYLMMLFFNRTGLERAGVVGPEPGLLWIGLKALDRLAGPGLLLGCFTGFVRCSSLQKNKKEEGSAGASHVAAPMPKSVSF